MSRSGKRRAAPGLPAWFIALVLVLAIAAWSIATTPAFAQAATPTAATAAGTPAADTMGTLTPPAGTPTPTATPTITPTPTATLTGLQARLVLAKAYLDGEDYDSAATLYAQIAEDTRGNAEALTGLQAALAGKAAIQATQMAPFPTEAPAPTPTPQVEATLASTTRGKTVDILATVLAGLLIIAFLYLIAALLRLVLTALRELWYLRVLPLFKKPAVPPGFLIAEFATPDDMSVEGAAREIPILITEKLIAWNQLVNDREIPVELAPDLDLGVMAWIQIFWRWLLPPPRGYRVAGALFSGSGQSPRLAVQRTNLSRNSVDRSRVFEGAPGETARDAFRRLAGEAAKWLLMPGDIEADQAVAMAKGFGDEAQAPNSASAVFDRAIDTLLPVRRQANQGLIDFPDARQRLRDAEAMVAQLPFDSQLRAELTSVIADLRRAVPAGS